MKWILENATKVIGLLSFSVVMLTTVHDWGYFSIIGPRFRALLSAYDYITNALEWMPFWGLAIVGMFALTRFVYSLIDAPSEVGFGSVHRRRWRRIAELNAFMVSLAGLVFFVSSYFLDFPSNQVALICGLMLALCGALALYVDRPDTTSEIGRSLIKVYAAAALVVFSYVAGIIEAEAAIGRPANVYKLKLKGDRIKTAVLLRTFEKGVLIWNIDSQTSELLRWDQVDGFSHIVAFDKTSKACREFSWFCDTSAGPM
jgi:hypothetical protein